MSTKKIPFSDNLDIVAMLVDNATIADWNLEGLPNDELSIQNGLIVTKASRYNVYIYFFYSLETVMFASNELFYGFWLYIPRCLVQN